MESTPVLRTSSTRGFTLAEMIVVLAIIGFITVIAISGQGNFNRSLTITDTAYTVALSIRQAQVYGLSSRAFSGTSNAGYGVHFVSASPSTYLIFADIRAIAAVPAYCPVGTSGLPDAKPGNCVYDANVSEMVQNYTFDRGFTVTNLCGHDTSGSILHCSVAQGGATVDLTGIDVVFLRPNTDSIVTGLRSNSPLQLSDAQITLTAPAGGSRLICVTKVGEVSVASTTCP